MLNRIPLGTLGRPVKLVLDGSFLFVGLESQDSLLAVYELSHDLKRSNRLPLSPKARGVVTNLRVSRGTHSDAEDKGHTVFYSYADESGKHKLSSFSTVAGLNHATVFESTAKILDLNPIPGSLNCYVLTTEQFGLFAGSDLQLEELVAFNVS
jgi:hypothetical protein